MTSSVREDDTRWFSSTRLYGIVAAIAALVLLVVTQAVCTIYKTRGKSSSNQKEQLIPSSAWKDYSAVNTNYAFEAYDESGKASILPAKSPPGHISASQMEKQGHPGGSSYTKSLQRSQQHGRNPAGNEMNTRSLPRTSQHQSAPVNYQGYYTHRPHSELQPDFYFMPSQRKYSGEVVRVYVDYNNVSKK